LEAVASEEEEEEEEEALGVVASDEVALEPPTSFGCMPAFNIKTFPLISNVSGHGNWTVCGDGPSESLATMNASEFTHFL